MFKRLFRNHVLRGYLIQICGQLSQNFQRFTYRLFTKKIFSVNVIFICCTVIFSTYESCSQNLSEIPVVFVHTGYAEYVKYALLQARQFNKHVILITDTIKNLDGVGVDIEFHDIKNYDANVATFTAPYVSEATQDLLLYSIQRWFILYEFMKKNELNIIFHCDTDVLLYADVTQQVAKFFPFDLVLTHDTALHYLTCRQYAGSSAYCTLSAVKSVCDYIVWFCNDKENWNKFAQKWNKNKCPMGEMFMLTSYMNNEQSKSLLIKDLNIIIDDCMFDNFIGSDCFNFSMKDVYSDKKHYRIKDIIFQEGLPYCYHRKLQKNIKLNSIHCFMGTKFLMKQFLHMQEN
jgi:hypothetical protein